MGDRWTQQFDPQTRSTYYVDLTTGESQWEKPPGFVVSAPHPESDGAVKIQSAFRAKRARDDVKQRSAKHEPHHPQSACNHDEHTHVEACLWDLVDAVAASEPQPLDEEENDAQEEVSSAGLSGLTWSAYFDPRTRRQYFVCNETLEIKFEPLPAMALLVQDSRVLSIQCAFRSHAARRKAARVRMQLQKLTDPIRISRKLDEINSVMDMLMDDLDARKLGTEEECEQFPHLKDLVISWSASVESLKPKVADLFRCKELLELAAGVTERIERGAFFHEACAELHNECLYLQRSIRLMNSYFTELDADRINAAFADVAKWKRNELSALTDPRMSDVVEHSGLLAIFTHVDTLLWTALGPDDYAAGVANTTGRMYEEWHLLVQAAIAGVNDLRDYLNHHMRLLQEWKACQAQQIQIDQMQAEDNLSSHVEAMTRRLSSQEQEHIAFVAMCRDRWQKGLTKRHADSQAAIANSTAQHQKEVKQLEHIAKLHKREVERRQKMKLSIWEAAKEGASVEVMRTMVFAEMQKARQLGYDFHLRSAQSDLGETLIQIACWWGHEHLVEFFIEEGANIDAVDSWSNRFSLLHDAARRGHVKVILVLLLFNMKPFIVDASGDTPLHWAVRRNHFDAIHALLGTDSAHRDQQNVNDALKALRTRNHRGRTPIQVAKSECVRRLLQAFEEGRTVFVPRLRSGSIYDLHAGRRMTEAPMRPLSFHLSKDGSPVHKTMSTKQLSIKGKTSNFWDDDSDIDEDEFGIINVISSRRKKEIIAAQQKFMLFWSVAYLQKKANAYELAGLYNALLNSECQRRIKMAAKTSMDRIETVIRATEQRLMPLALQRLSIGEILGDTTSFAAFRESLPSKEELHVTPEQEPVFYRLLKFLNVHEPTARENDEAHKRNVVQYLALQAMLQECQCTKLASLQQACVSRVLCWFDETFGPTRVGLSKSTPILPPRMSPKKTTAAGLLRTTSDTGLLEESTEAVNDMVAKKLERYKVPNLRASHIRRIAALRSRGADIDDEFLDMSEQDPVRVLETAKPVDSERVAQQQRIQATFRSYRPETDAEREMNLLWLKRRQEEEMGRRKDAEIQQLVNKWSIDRSRDESEFLRKRETTKLVAGLERAHQTEFSTNSQKRPQSSATANERRQETDAALSKSSSSTQLKESIPRPNDRTEQTGSVVVKIRKHSKQIASGGMHFRNQLPANYTPSSRGSSSSTSSGHGGSPFTSLSSSNSSSGIRSEKGREKVVLESSGSSSDSDGDASDSRKEEDEEKRERKRVHSAGLGSTKGSQNHTMQSYHIPYFNTSGNRLETTSESVPSSGSAAFKRMYPPGTIPPQPKPADPEFRHFYDATTARQVAPSTLVTVMKAPPLSRVGSTKTLKLNASSTELRKTPPRPSTTSKMDATRGVARASQSSTILPLQRRASNASGGAGSLGAFPASSESVSDLRRAQLLEMEKIRLLFEQNHLQFNDSAFERGLLVPEDRSAMDCAQNLPISGSRLVMNPLASTRLRAGLGKKKKRASGKKKKKKGAKGVKSARSSPGKTRK